MLSKGRKEDTFQFIKFISFPYGFLELVQKHKKSITKEDLLIEFKQMLLDQKIKDYTDDLFNEEEENKKEKGAAAPTESKNKKKKKKKNKKAAVPQNEVDVI